MGMYGPGSIDHIQIVAKGVGFCSSGVTYSPSSGSGQSYWFTVNEWADHVLLDGTADRSIMELSAKNAGSLFVNWYNTVSRLSSITRFQNGPAHQYDYPILSYTTMAIEPVGDTVCMVATMNTAGLSVIIRTTPTGSVELDTIPGILSRAVDIAFQDTMSGAVLLHGNAPGSAIRMTHDGGHSWTQVWNDSGRKARALAWSGEQTLWVVGDGGLVIATHDGGVTWSAALSPTDSDLVAIATCAEDSIWVGGAGGVIHASGDPFISWTDHSLQATTVRKLTACEGLIYAEVGGELYKLPLGKKGLLRAGTGTWWTYAEDGIQLRTDEDETLVGLGLYDLQGREVNVTMVGGRIIMRDLPGGLFVMEFSSNKRLERGKILWIPMGR